MGRASACSILIWITLCSARESLGLLLVRHPAGMIVSPINIPVSSLKCTAACYSNCTLQWFRTTDDDSATNATELSVTNEHWQSAYGISYPLYTYQERKNGETEVHSALVIYKFATAYAGTYFCRAVEGAISVESIRIELRVRRTGNSEEEPTKSLPSASPSCYPPVIDNFLVNKSAESNKESLCVDVTWTIRSSRWCNGSRIELLRAEWDRVEDTPDNDFADSNTSSATFNWKHSLSIPVTNSSTHICGLNYQKYYEFQLRVSSEQSIGTAKFNSHIYHFGLQVPARVLWAPTRLSHKVGKSLILPCYVDGIPKPSVTWLRSYTGKSRLGSSRQTANTPEYSPIFYFRTIRVVHHYMTGNYQCVARNKIVNPPSGVHERLDAWHMSLKIE